ncbi:MAG: hypothetical protein ACYCZ7_02145 [Minisyncoccota bacterium]
MIKPILSLIVIVFSIGFAFFYVKPEYDRAQSARADLQKLEQTSQSASDIKEIIAETAKSLSAITPEDLERSNVFLPETLDVIRFANDLQHIGTANGLALAEIEVEQQEKQIQQVGTKTAGVGAVSKVFSLERPVNGGAVAAPAGSVSEKKYVATKASFSVVATYPGFLVFLKDMEKSLGLINITALSFEEIGASVDEKRVQRGLPALYQFTIDLETYSLK